MYKQGHQMQSRILSTLQGERMPLSAYDLLARLQRGKHGNPRLAPPTIYRALSALIQAGKVHRLESKNAYVACQCGHHPQAALMAVCNSCGEVEETLAPEIFTTITDVASQSGFVPERHIIEIYGLCATCDAGAATAPPEHHQRRD